MNTMAKEAYYFSHDYGARNDPKLQKVLMKLGQEGKGVYWDLVEMLFEEGGKLLLSECDGYAFALRTNETCITKLINDFGLFRQDSTHFWSDSVNRRISERDSKSEKARQSALNRWNNANALKKDANALLEECDGNAIKEKKGKEIYSEFSFFNNGFDKVWKDYLKMRVAIKKKATEEAEILALKNLSRLSNDDKELAIKIVEQSIQNSWQGLFELKGNVKQPNSFQTPIHSAAPKPIDHSNLPV